MATAYAYTASNVKVNNQSLSPEGKVKVLSTNNFSDGDTIRVKKYSGLSVVALGISHEQGTLKGSVTTADNVITISKTNVVASTASAVFKRMNVIYTYMKVN